MSGSGAHLSLFPERCDCCGRCERACPVAAIKPGVSYIYVDWHACTQCGKCVDACDRGAIERSMVTTRPNAASAVGPSDVAKVVVGSRAEAKAVRKAAEKAAKASGKAGAVSYSGKGGKTAAAIAAQVAGRDGDAQGSAPRTAGPKRTAASFSDSVALGGPPPGSAAWRPIDVVLVLGVLLVTLVAKDAVFGLSALALMPSTGRAIARAGVLVVFYSVQLASIAWLAQRRGMRMGQSFGLRRAAADTASATRPAAPAAVSRVGSAGLVLLLLVACEAFTIAYGLAMQAVGFAQPERLSSDLAAVFGSGVLGIALSVALVVIVAPFAEELAFRGIALGVMAGRWGGWPGIVISALLFATYHFSVWMFAPTMVLGVALAWLAWTRRSLWPAIWLHILYNGVAVAAGFLATR